MHYFHVMSDSAFYHRLTTITSPDNSTIWQVLLQGAFDVLVFVVSGLTVNALVLHGGYTNIYQPFWQGGLASVFVTLLACWLVWFGVIRQTYTRHKPFWTDLLHTLTVILVFAVLDLALIGLLQVGYSRWWWLLFWACMLVLMPVGRSLSRRMLAAIGKWQRHALIYGVGPNAWQAYLALLSEPSLGVIVEGFITPKGLLSQVVPEIRESALPVVLWTASPDEVRGVSDCTNVIAFEADEREHRDACIRQLTQHMVKSVRVIPAMRGVPLYGMETSHFFSHEVLLIHLRNNLSKPIYKAAKRLFDLIVSMILLSLLSPLFAWLAYKVSRDGGKAFYGHERVGQDGKFFNCYKFRSMVVNSQEVLQALLASDPVARAEWEKDFKLKDDPRITPIGALLRKTSLDELPQLWNVLKGEMSLVGPRPVVHAELERYESDVSYYLLVRPGMTGLWQVSGRNDVDYATRVYLDSWYVKNWSLWSDIAILFKTVKVVVGRSGAY